MRFLFLSMLIAAPAFATPKNARTIEITPDRLLVGSTLYRVCEPCHGLNGEGHPAVSARLTSKTFLEAIGDEQLIQTIKEGRAGTAMVSWDGILTRAQMEGIVAYIRKQMPTTAATLNEAPCTGDAKKGAALFARSCATCHDPSQSRYRRWGTQITGKDFQDQVSDGFLRYIIRHGKTGTAMRPFKGNSPLPELNLSDSDVEHLVAFLRSKQTR